ncbi:hypothetical protein EP867_13905 [Falsigemmobacter intermedius]|uniref:Uncharacterized protein n=1 Tax=Falsigemmobacter intermedius TaxID=1553448 RepID=A0A444M9F4_9RHOB|nr:hypothetical protein EP867_13905 [Falsigemmobacter intermedius]
MEAEPTPQHFEISRCSASTSPEESGGPEAARPAPPLPLPEGREAVRSGFAAAAAAFAAASAAALATASAAA